MPLPRTPLCPHGSSSPGGRGSRQPPPCTSAPSPWSQLLGAGGGRVPASAPKATLSTPPTCPHLSSGLVRKGHLRSARTWGCGGFCPQIPPCVGQEPLGWAGLCAPTTRLPPGPPAGAPFSPSVRSTYEGLFPRLHLRRHERGVCEITAATQTARHTGHGGGAFQPWAELSPQSHLSAEAQGDRPPPEAKHQAQAAQNDQAL